MSNPVLIESGVPQTWIPGNHTEQEDNNDAPPYIPAERQLVHCANMHAPLL